MFSLSDTILLRGMRTSGPMDNVMISLEDKERGLEKIKSEKLSVQRIFIIVED